MGLKRAAKSLLFRPGRKDRRLKGGINAGLWMSTDLAHDTQRWLGLYEREIAAWIERLAPGCATCCDVGANDGYYTLFFLLRTHARRVLAFEPDAGPRAQLEANLALNPGASERLTVSPEFVGAGDGGVTLDEALLPLEPPYLVKADIEGGELAMLEGASQLLAGRQVRWIIETHSPQLERDCVAFLAEHRYRTTVVPNAWWRVVLPELRPLELNRWLVATPD